MSVAAAPWPACPGAGTPSERRPSRAVVPAHREAATG